MIHNLWINELIQSKFIADEVNKLVDKYNSIKKEDWKPLFEFQRNDFQKKMVLDNEINFDDPFRI